MMNFAAEAERAASWSRQEEGQFSMISDFRFSRIPIWVPVEESWFAIEKWWFYDETENTAAECAF